MTQWHPIFGHLLRPVLAEYYDVEINVPVGDLPREADILLLRRASTKKPPFRSLWKHLSRWNILELKGRSESARVGDIDLLLEVGLGIQRRLNEKEPRVKVARGETSFWYLANHLGKRFLRDVIELTGELTAVSPGLWQGRCAGRSVWLVSNRDVPIEEESVPLHLVSDESLAKARELARVVVSEDRSWKSYAFWLSTLYPNLWKEMFNMVRKRNKGEIDWGFLIREYGKLNLLDPSLVRLVVDQVGLESFLATLTPEERATIARTVGGDVKPLGDGQARQVLDEIGLDAFLRALTPEQRAEAARRLQPGTSTK